MALSTPGQPWLVLEASVEVGSTAAALKAAASTVVEAASAAVATDAETAKGESGAQIALRFFVSQFVYNGVHSKSIEGCSWLASSASHRMHS